MKYEEILDVAKRIQLPSKDIEAIAEFLEYNEWGIAFEVLCSAIKNDLLSVSKDEFIRINLIGESMDMDKNLWEIFRP